MTSLRRLPDSRTGRPGEASLRDAALTSIQRPFSHLSLLFFASLQDAAASYDFNDNDPDPFPRYDATNENK